MLSLSISLVYAHNALPDTIQHEIQTHLYLSFSFLKNLFFMFYCLVLDTFNLKRINMLKKITLIAASVAATTSIASPLYDINYAHKGTSILTTADYEAYIIGGKDAVIEDFPFYARIGEKSGETEFNDFCGGAIMNEEFIITAAHCLEDITDSNIDSIGIVLNNGSREALPEDSILSIERVIIHPEYSKSLLINDIGLVKLAEPLDDENQKYTTIPTTSEMAEYNAADTVVAMGLGYIDDDKTKPTVIQQATMTKLTDENCKTLVESTYNSEYTSLSQTCTLPLKNEEDELTGVCNGDSGGPLTFEEKNGSYTQFALTSYGAEASCSAEGVPQVFTDITGYADWIECYIDGCDGFEGNFGDSGDSSGGSTGLLSLFGLALLGLRRRTV